MFQRIQKWFGFGRTQKSRKTSRTKATNNRRLLRHEQLEDRRMLATLTVSVDDDGAIAENDGNLTLREAVAYVNQDAFPGVNDQAHITGTLGTNDTILFDSSLAGGTILLTEGELDITEAVTIDASTLSGSLTVDASGNDNDVNVDNGGGTRVFHIDLFADPGQTEQVTLAGLTITGGDHPLIANVTSSGGGGDAHLSGFEGRVAAPTHMRWGISIMACAA